MPAFFALTLFIGSALLFLVQPMIAKMILPRLGGSPTVWNTCMVFYQALLLAGYAYAHFLSSRLRERVQIILHLCLFVLPLLFVLPVAIPADAVPPQDSFPGFWLVGLLTVVVGLPFFIVSANAPLLQAWFAKTGHPSAKDPYFLYSASNLGSMLALVSYPLVWERELTLAGQSRWWTAGYLVLGVLLVGCAAFVWRTSLFPSVSKKSKTAVSEAREAADVPVTGKRRLWWVALAFVPSSLMLSVTTYLTTDIAAIPLLWVIPLSLYLLSFIIVFARRPWLKPDTLVPVVPRVVLVLALVLLSEATEPVWLVTLIHLLGLLVIALACHGDLARDRPATAHLTEFYLWLSVGGVLGGLFNSFVAPLVFRSVAEYPLALVLACLLQPHRDPTANRPRDRVLDWALPIALFVVTTALVLGFQRSGMSPGTLSVTAMFVVPVLACYLCLRRPWRFGLSVAAVLLAGWFYHGVHGEILHRERDFFGVHRVTRDPQTGDFHQLVHGNIVHGRQRWRPQRTREPLTYFNTSGPIGQVFEKYSGPRAKRRVGVVGLGTGSMISYGEPPQEWTFFEVDPAVERIARNERFFTFLAESKVPVRVVLGDARLTLSRESDRSFDLLILDAFSSDAIPAHLLTREALAIYLSKLADGGIIAFHISNNHLNLEPVLGALARDAKLTCLAQEHRAPTDEEKAAGGLASHWVVLARKQDDVLDLARDLRWHFVEGARASARVWTDDFHDLIEVFEWQRPDD